MEGNNNFVITTALRYGSCVGPLVSGDAPFFFPFFCLRLLSLALMHGDGDATIIGCKGDSCVRKETV